jgi:uncharacterized membrane protein YGL010W
MKIMHYIPRPNIFLWLGATLLLYVAAAVVMHNAAILYMRSLIPYTAPYIVAINVLAITWPLLFDHSRIKVFFAQVIAAATAYFYATRCSDFGCLAMIVILVTVAITSVFAAALLHSLRLVIFPNLSSVI